MQENHNNKRPFRYKVHSAIYSYCDPESKSTITQDVSNQTQELLDSPKAGGILKIADASFKDSIPSIKKSFAVIVSVVAPDGKETTRFCTAQEGDSIDIKKSGVICEF